MEVRPATEGGCVQKGVLERPVKTLVERDLELPTQLRCSRSDRAWLQRHHEFTAIRYTEVSVLSECYVCGRTHQAQRRVTIVNNSLQKSFQCGLDCMEKYFSLERKDLEKSSFPLKRIASAWEAFRRAADASFAGFGGTKEAVADMHERFSELSREKPAMRQVRNVLADILRNLVSVQGGAFDEEISALRNLLGIMHEAAKAPDTLRDRSAALTDHPLLTRAQQDLAVKVLENPGALAWRDLLILSQALSAIATRKVTVRLKDAPAYKFESETDYLLALKARAREIVNGLNERERLEPASSFYRHLRETARELRKQKGGLATLVFEDASLKRLEALEPDPAMFNELRAAGVHYLAADGAKHYEETTVRLERISVREMLKEGQLEEKEGEPRKPRAGYLRSVVLYLPDPYHSCYAVWFRYGGMREGRRRLEDLTSSLL